MPRKITLLRTCMVALCAAAWQMPAALAEDAGNAPARTVKVKDITLEVPAGWKQSPASNKLRLAQFDIPPVEGDKESAELVISSFGGGGGGIEANVRRWIDQFEADGRKAKLTTGKSPQGEYVLVDLQGTYKMPVGPPFLRQTKPMPGARMLSVILQVEKSGNYFLKLTGPEATVSSQADALRASFGANAKEEKPYELPES